jgi:DNA mismatch endonuclease (patch repair protein)
MDTVTPSVRTKIMAAVPQRNTTPERLVRRELHAMGLRFRLHRKTLPGSPDIVLPKFKTAIFVHGCFWHRHHGCSRTTTPRTRAEFWASKFERNLCRDRENVERLQKMGWRVVVVWECETRDPAALRRRLTRLFSARVCRAAAVAEE